MNKQYFVLEHQMFKNFYPNICFNRILNIILPKTITCFKVSINQTFNFSKTKYYPQQQIDASKHPDSARTLVRELYILNFVIILNNILGFCDNHINAK